MSRSLHDTIRRLEAYTDSPSPILSVYLHLPPNQTNIAREFNSLLEERLSEKEKIQLEDNIEYIVGFLQEYHPKKNEQTIVIFSGGNNLFEIIRLDFPLHNSLTVASSPDLFPLLSAFSEYRRYLAIFFDRKKAIFFTLIDGTVENKEEVIDPSVPQNVHENAEEAMHNQREDKINRHIQQHIDRHFDLVTQKVQEFLQERPILGIVLGGHKNLFHSFIQHLPKWMKERVVGEITSELNTNFNTLVRQTNKAIASANKKFNEERHAYIFQ